MYSMEELIHIMIEREASDIHLVVGTPPQIRVDGELIPLKTEKLNPDVCQELVYSVLTESQKRRFEETNELDLSFGVREIGRIRMNVFRQRGTVGAALRSIPNRTLSFEALGLPPSIHEMAKLTKGLVLVTGPTGSGKSTTLAAIIEHINQHRKEHIVTVEDPIEYLYSHKNCIISQREVEADTESFSAALKFVLRQDPDVIMVGEMRDLETINATLTIAETGHLVLATLHTPDAVQSINRIIDVFPPYQQPQVRAQLSFVIQAVFSQQLLPRAGGKGRVLACEVLIVTPGLRNLIREEKVHQAYTLMQAGGREGMQTMNMSLADLFSRDLITAQEALSRSLDPNDLKRYLDRGSTRY